MFLGRPSASEYVHSINYSWVHPSLHTTDICNKHIYPATAFPIQSANIQAPSPSPIRCGHIENDPIETTAAGLALPGMTTHAAGLHQPVNLLSEALIISFD